jgi:hypothetical protein
LFALKGGRTLDQIIHEAPGSSDLPLKNFSIHTRFEVRDDSKIRFLHDLWCRDRTLKEAFSVWYSIACVKDASLADYLELSTD